MTSDWLVAFTLFLVVCLIAFFIWNIFFGSPRK